MEVCFGTTTKIVLISFVGKCKHLVSPWLLVMHLVDFVEILVPIAFALSHLSYFESVELGAGGLIVLEPLHQVFCGSGNQEVSYPKDIGIHVSVFTVVQQIERQVQHLLRISSSAKKREIALLEVFSILLP